MNHNNSLVLAEHVQCTQLFPFKIITPSSLQDSLDLSCVTNSAISELYRGIRQQAPSLLGISEENMGLMSLGLAHSLSRYKLKFSPDKVDTMIIQAICELNIFYHVFVLNHDF